MIFDNSECWNADSGVVHFVFARCVMACGVWNLMFFLPDQFARYSPGSPEKITCERCLVVLAKMEKMTPKKRGRYVRVRLTRSHDLMRPYRPMEAMTLIERMLAS